MKVLVIANLKGGVGKTISAVNIAHILAEIHGKRVLLIDNDKQGNSSKFFGLHDEERASLGDVLTSRDQIINQAIRNTRYGKLDVLPANMSLLYADRQILIDSSRPQQTRLRKALEALRAQKSYDYVIVDNAPDLSMSAINAFVACNDLMIPIKVDSFAFDGVQQILQQVEDVREFNPGIRVLGGFVTMYQQDMVNRQGAEVLREQYPGLTMMKSKIRKATAIDQTTFTGIPIAEYRRKSQVAEDYLELVKEYLKKSGGGSSGGKV